MNRASAIKTVDLCSISGQFKSKSIKNGIHNFPTWRSAIKGDSVKPPPYVVDRWQLDSKTKKSLHHFLAKPLSA